MNFIHGDLENPNNPITFGSIIAISYASDPNSFIFTNGFSRSNIFVKNMQKFDENPIENLHKNKEKKCFFSSCLFLISPIFSNNLKQDALTLINRALKAKIPEENPEEGSFNQINEEITLEKINQTKSKIISEYKSNMEIFNKFKKKPMNFNQSFQLIHLDSYKYLACYDKEADHEKENFSMQLDEYPSEHTIFRITPAFKFQKDAEQSLNENETVFITHMNRSFRKEVFLHASEEISILQQQKLNIYEPKEKDHQRQKSYIVKREANASIEQKSFWKLQLFSSDFEEDSSFLKGGDIIWIYHSELNASLSARKKLESFNLFRLKGKKNIIEEIPKNFDETQIEFIKNDTLKEKFEDFKANTCGVWIIEGADSKKGELIQYGENFRLKHLGTGRYLTIKRDEIKNNLCLALEENNTRNQIEELQQKNTFFNFFPLSSLLTSVSSKNIEKNSFTYIRNVNTKKWLDAMLNEKSMQFEEGENNSAVNPVLKENFTEKEIFRIQKAPKDLIWELKFLNVFEATLSNFLVKIQNYNVISFEIYYF